MDAPTEGMTNTFPVKTKQKAVNINGNDTDLLCSCYADKLFIIITQYKKIGTLVELSRDVVLDDIVPARTSYSTKVLLGVDEPLTHVVAKNLLAKVNSNKPILLGMSLKDNAPKTVAALSEAVRDVL